jgi:hypothetical protein
VSYYKANQVSLGDQIKKNEMGGSCSTYEGGERCIQDFCREP